MYNNIEDWTMGYKTSSKMTQYRIYLILVIQCGLLINCFICLQATYGLLKYVQK